MAYIIRRGAFYYLNLRLPKTHTHRCHTLRLSLDIRDRQSAIFLASSIAQKVHLHLAEHPLDGPSILRKHCAAWLRDTPPPPIKAEMNSQHRISEATPKATIEGPLLSTLAKLYLDEGTRSGTWRVVSAQEVERALKELFELMGDMDAASFSSEHARALKGRLSRCPQYFGLKPEFEGMTLRQVIDSGRAYKPISAVTVNNRLRKLTAFFGWCQTNGYLSTNPLTGVKVMTGSAKEARLSFDTDDLAKLLDLPTLRQEAKKHPWRFWIPLLGRTTGARLEELCQLYTDDITSVNGIHCIRIADQHEGQQLKNPGSRRVIPLAPSLLQLGFLDYVEKVSAVGAQMLFADLKAVRGKYGHAPSKWFGRYKLKLGISDSRKTFHSFRHTFIDEMRDCGVQDSLVKRMVGHEDSSTTFGIYGSRTPIAAMLKALEQLPPQQP
ncbi:site-specific integrase [Aquipseudomonas ullengensis]|uniref:Site-specific integrase n=1 Tax=Aquipseudomonas ullengensis TaxID=2759166 RepID=A0A7W4LMP8_9GAMM|nr:site-specific integrase [Pseudomonas ullengensis]MBB2495958.1 site-specific integrase [Pseudomonas ullengensis]